MKLLDISDAQGGGLLFRFDDAGVEREWLFGAGSLAEFLALLLGGELRARRSLETAADDVRISVGPGQPSRLHLQLAAIELVAPLSDDQMRSLAESLRGATLGSRH